MKSIIVTGGTGFIGANFVLSALADKNYRVLVLDQLTYAGNLASLSSVVNNPRFRFVEGDICEGTLVGELLESEKPDGIVHFAAESHVDRSIDAPSEFIQTNIIGTFTLLEEVRKYLANSPSGRAGDFRFVHVSTDEVSWAGGPVP